MAPVRSIKCISRPPSRFPSVLVSLGRIISVISDCESATIRTIGLVSVELILLLAPFPCLSQSVFQNPPAISFCSDCFQRRHGSPPSSYNGTGGGRSLGRTIPVSAIHANYANLCG